MFSKLSLKFKMLAAFVLTSMLLLVVGGISWHSNRQVSEIYSVIADQNLPNVGTVGRIRYRAQEANRVMLRAIFAKTPESVEQYSKEFSQSLEIYAGFTKKYSEIPFLPGEAELFEASETHWKKFVTTAQRIFAHAAKSETDQAEKLLETEIVPARAAHVEALDKLLTFHEKHAEESKKAALEATHRGEVLIALVIGVGFLFSISLGFLFANSLARSLTRISSEISGAADQTSASGTQLSAASQQLSAGSTEAAASLEETVASIEELSSIVKLNADHAQEANALSQKSRDSAEQGEQEITKLIAAMEDIANGSKKIEEIINVIDDIAFQTNLLALNAAVEAARAGEQGKGFAVVAEAVRALAQRSAEAAKDINSLIHDNVAKSESGAKIASQSGVVLKDIVNSVKKVADLNSEISVASNEQSHGLEQISKAMNQLDQATQGNAASSEEVAASSEEMSAQAVLLAELVTDLRALVQGQGASGTTRKQTLPKAVAPKIHAKPTLVKGKDSPEVLLPLEQDQERKVGNVSGF